MKGTDTDRRATMDAPPIADSGGAGTSTLDPASAHDDLASPSPSPSMMTPGNGNISHGLILWTLAKGSRLAQARRWRTRLGHELEVKFWSSPVGSGQEDLSWSQIFPNDEAADDAAALRKHQLEELGWIETLDSPDRVR